jgi:outer membrane protein
VLLGVAENAAAGEWLDFIRNYDLNDYALGVAVTTRQSPYIGGENSTIAYPYLTSFTHSAFTTDWLLIRDGGYGIRWVSDNEWEFGVIARIGSLSLGNSKADELVGVADRKWTLEAGPTIGWRGWPVQIHWTTWVEVTDRHGGFSSDLDFSYPIQFDRGFVVPSLAAIYESSEKTNYFFSVSEAEATPTRPAYTPGSAVHARARVRVGYALTEKWLLSGTLSVKFLDSVVTDSPIVDRGEVWSVNLGLAYNANVFNPVEFSAYTRRPPRLELRVGAFQGSINSKLSRDTADGIPGFEIDLEDVLGETDEQTVTQWDLIWRIGQHHQIEAGYFELARQGLVTLEDDLQFGDVLFPAGTVIKSRTDYSSLRLGYTFYLMRDAQKELGVMAGIHVTDFSTDIVAAGIGETARSRSNTPLPYVGVNGAVFLGEKTTLSARLHFFWTEFDEHEGFLSFAALDLERRFGDNFSVGIGYNFYGTNLSSHDDDLNGDLKIRHRGPVLFMSLGF